MGYILFAGQYVKRSCKSSIVKTDPQHLKMVQEAPKVQAEKMFRLDLPGST